MGWITRFSCSEGSHLFPLKPTAQLWHTAPRSRLHSPVLSCLRCSAVISLATDRPQPVTLKLNWICLVYTAVSTLSSERISSVRTLRRCLLTTLWCALMWTHGTVQQKLSWPCFLRKGQKEFPPLHTSRPQNDEGMEPFHRKELLSSLA